MPFGGEDKAMNLKTNPNKEELTREEAIVRFGREPVENGDSEIENDSADVDWEDVKGNSLPSNDCGGRRQRSEVYPLKLV
jgi:hypothetical protein